MRFINYHRILILPLIIFLLAPVINFAQKQGDIQVVQDDKVDLLVSKHVIINQNSPGIEGFRIQIFFDSGSNSKSRAQSVYESFRAKFPGTGAYLTFKTPNYKVRVGDFRTKLDAQRFLNEILPEYPNAWITADVINLPQVE